MTKLNKNIGFSLSLEDKTVLKKKAKELGLSMSAMIRNIVLEKYKSLSIGYIKASNIQAPHDIDIKGLKKPSQLTLKKRPPSRSDAYIADLKNVFTNLSKASNKGINILENMENAGLKTKAMFKMKTDKELKQVLRDKNVRIFLKKVSYAFSTLLS